MPPPFKHRGKSGVLLSQTIDQKSLANAFKEDSGIGPALIERGLQRPSLQVMIA